MYAPPAGDLVSRPGPDLYLHRSGGREGPGRGSMLLRRISGRNGRRHPVSMRKQDKGDIQLLQAPESLRKTVSNMGKDNNTEVSPVQPGRQKSIRRLRLRNLVTNLFFFSIVGTGLVWACGHFWKYMKYDITNDAFIDQYVSPVNIRVSGYIREIRFREHQYVHKGDTLLILDDSEYSIHVKEAEAAILWKNPF